MFRKFTYRGIELEDLLKMPSEEVILLFNFVVHQITALPCS